MPDVFDKLDVFDGIDVFDILESPKLKAYVPPPRVSLLLTDEIRQLIRAEIGNHLKHQVSQIVSEVKPERVIHVRTIEKEMVSPPERVIVREVDMEALEKAVEKRLKTKMQDYEKNWKNIAPIVVPNGIANQEGHGGQVLSTDGRQTRWIDAPTGTGTSGTNLFDYTMTNVTSRIVFDPTDTSLDEVADVMGTLIAAMQAAPSPFAMSGFAVVNVTPTTSFDADSTSLDTIAHTLGTLITTLQAGTLDTYTVTNALYRHTCDADNTSLDEIADVLGSCIASLRGAGVIQ